MPHWVIGFLAFTFVAHCAAFTILGVRRKKSYYFFLTGTFFCLTAVYVLKFLELKPMVMNTEMPWIMIIRIAAILCTLTYLTTIACTPDTWLNRLIASRRRAGPGSSAD